MLASKYTRVVRVRSVYFEDVINIAPQISQNGRYLISSIERNCGQYEVDIKFLVKLWPLIEHLNLHLSIHFDYLMQSWILTCSLSLFQDLLTVRRHCRYIRRLQANYMFFRPDVSIERYKGFECALLDWLLILKKCNDRKRSYPIL